MILTYGDVSKLVEKDWNVIELRSEKTSEETIKRIGKILPTIFKQDPVEVFVPIAKRDLDTFDLMTDCYIFVRSLDPKKIVKLRSITGVVWIVCQGEGTHPSRLINVDKVYIGELIDKCKLAYDSRSIGIVVGSFVRIIDGHTRDFCGTVQSIDNDTAVIQVDLRTTTMLVETPIKNLINIDSVPKELRVFYYSPVIYVDRSDTELVDMLKEDLVGDRVIEVKVKTIQDDDYQEAVKSLESHVDGGKKNQKLSKIKRTNQQMVTAYVKNLIFDGEKDVRQIANRLFKAIEKDEIKRPKNLVIAWCVIKYQITHTMYGHDQDIKSYKDVIQKYGSTYKISIKELAKMAPWLPVASEDECTDGRSKRARAVKTKHLKTSSRTVPSSMKEKR